MLALLMLMHATSWNHGFGVIATAVAQRLCG
jgi:hypothetical protein